jgi:predicted permease
VTGHVPGAARLVIAGSAWLVPAARRLDWRRQWTADLVCQAAWLRNDGRRPSAVRRDLLVRSLGAVRHAWYLRRHGWRTSMIGQDIKYAWRALARRPGFTAAIVLTLGLGIGANVTIFSWIDAVLLSPLPGVPRASELVLLRFASQTRNDLSFSYLNYRDVRDARPDGLSGLAVMSMMPLSMRAGGDPERVWAQIVSGNFFDVLDVSAAHGRPLRPDDEGAPGQSAVAVISDRLWRGRFASDPAVIGRSIGLNGRPFAIVGVAPPGFVGGMSGLSMDVWVPVTMHAVLTGRNILDARGSGWLMAIGRRQPSVSAPALDASVRTIASRLEQDQAVPKDWTLRVAPLSEEGAAGVLLPVLSVVMGVVGLVLLIACANVSGLLLSRGVARRREVAIRAALGGSRFHLARQMFVESLVLALAGGAAGVAIATWTSRGLDALLPPMPYPVLIGASVNLRVLAFSAGVVVLATMAFGLAPAVQGSRAGLQEALRASSTAGTTVRRARLRRGLVVGQIALAMVLLVCAGLFVRTLAHTYDVDPGFSRRHAVLASFDLSSIGYTADQGRAFLSTALERLEALPDVESASVSTLVPLSASGGADTSPTIDGYAPRPGEEIVVYYGMVGRGYFETMGVPVLRGRGIDDRDRAGAEPVVVINDTMARRYWPDREAIGGRLRTGDDWITVVGVVKDGKYGTLNEAPRAVMYLPIQQVYRANPTVHVATRGPAEPAMAAVRRAMTELAPDLALFDVRTLSEHLRLSVAVPRMAAILLALFGGLALLLAAVGLYGVIAFFVGQRTREIGVRMALGAERATILRQVLGQGARTAGLGLALGLGLAVAASPALASLLVNLSPTDVPTYVATAVILFAVALLATWLPARRAAAVDPVEALRME